MSYVIATPELMTSAATDLATIGANVSAAHLVAAARTTAVLPAAADEVSASIAHLFSQHAANYQALAGQAAAFNNQFVHNLTSGAGAYASAEAANVSLLTADAAVVSLLDPFIKFSTFASQFITLIITLISENPGYFFGFVLPIWLIFGSFGLLALPYLFLFSPFILLFILTNQLPHILASFGI
jgi:hypothetical protein